MMSTYAVGKAQKPARGQTPAEAELPQENVCEEQKQGSCLVHLCLSFYFPRTDTGKFNGVKQNYFKLLYICVQKTCRDIMIFENPSEIMNPT